ncbi:MAG: hypothetical protein ACMZ7B_01175 [Balneola sp.]
MIEWLINNPIIAGVITTLLMWTDWLLTRAQEKERRTQYYKHYESYPVNTIEGNPMLRNEVAELKLFSLKHSMIAVVFGVFIALFLTFVPAHLTLFYLGFFWGIFLIVITQHLSNLIAYRVSRKGIHGKIRMHLRTGYYIQSGRYFASALLLLILSLLIQNIFLFGITIAAFISSLRMLIWANKTPQIEE